MDISNLPEYRLMRDDYKLIGFDSETTEHLVIPNMIEKDGVVYRVTSIGDGAFYGCESLKSVIIPEGVTSIGKGAFSGCMNLTSVTIPDSVTSIDDRMFMYCDNLEVIYYNGTAEGAPWGAINAKVVHKVP